MNKDISFNISLMCLKFSIHVDVGRMEGSVSQILYLGPSFHFMKYRKKVIRNVRKLPVFWDKIKTEA